MKPPWEEEAVAAALRVRRLAYAPYSQFLVGAALVTPAGKLIVGCNVENVSLGLTNCAERVALGAAVAAGEREFCGLAIASAGGVSPCGACRQALAEFAGELEIALVDCANPSAVRYVNLRDLLPGQFRASFPPRS